MLAKFIQEQRKKRNFSQEFLASELGISRPTYVQIEQGERDLTITEAEKLSSVFGILFEYFRHGKDSDMVALLKASCGTASSLFAGGGLREDFAKREKFKEVLL